VARYHRYREVAGPRVFEGMLDLDMIWLAHADGHNGRIPTNHRLHRLESQMLNHQPDLIAMSNTPTPQSASAQGLVIVPASAVNPMHSAMSDEARLNVLQIQYRRVSVLDAYFSGNTYTHPTTGVLQLVTTRPEPSFKGLVFEAALARWCRESPATTGKRVFAWCTQRSINRITDDFFAKYTAFVRNDKTLQRRKATAILYNTGSPFDVQFYSMNERHGLPEVATVVNTNVEAGVQVKAIAGNEMEEIIKPILDGRYTHVLTMLNHDNGQHSFEVCMTILNNLNRNGKITSDQYALVTSRLTYPQALGIDQQMVNSYSFYLSQIYQNGANWTGDVFDAISLEVTQNMTMSEGGILMPTAPVLQVSSTTMH
jgi:hypothetical protein